MNPMELVATEILQKILGYLPLDERIRAERVCKRWKNVSTEQVWRDVHVLYIFRPEYKKGYRRLKGSTAKIGKLFKMEDNKLYIAAEDLGIIQSLVSRAGKHIKKLTLNVNSDELTTRPILSIMAAHCHNIEVIQLHHVGNSEIDAFSKLLEVNRQLHSFACYAMENSSIEILSLRDWKALGIGSFHFDEDAWDTELVALVDNSPSLEKFYVYSWTPNLSAAISKCKQLKTLHFPTWREEAAYDLMSNSPLLNRLTHLSMHGGVDDDSVVTEVLSRCINLKSLELVDFLDSYGFTPTIVRAVMDLPMLESLILEASSVTDEILSLLLKFKHLRFSGGDSKFTEEGIFNMIKNSKDLENLELPQISLSQKFFRRLIKGTGERRKIFKIEVPTDIYEEALKICEGSKILVIENLDRFDVGMRFWRP